MRTAERVKSWLRACRVVPTATVLAFLCPASCFAQLILKPLDPAEAEARLEAAVQEYGRAERLVTEGKFSEALSITERVLRTVTEILGPEDPDTAQVTLDLASLCEAVNDLHRARTLYERAIVIFRKRIGEQHPETAKAYNGLGYVQLEMGDFAEARNNLEKSLSIRTQVFPQDQSALAESKNNLGYLLYAIGDYDNAFANLKDALDILKNGSDKYAISGANNNIGLLLQYQGRFIEARSHYDDALRAAESIPDTALPHDKCNAISTSWNNIGYLLGEIGDDDEAREYLEKSLELTEKCWGEKHPAVAVVLSNLGSVMQDLDKLDLSRTYYDRALAIVGKGTPEYCDILFNLCDLEMASGNSAKAWEHVSNGLRERGEFLNAQLPQFNEPEMLNLVETMNGEIDAVLSLPPDVERNGTKLEAVLKRKAMVFHLLCRMRQIRDLILSDANIASRVSMLHAWRTELLSTVMSPSTDPDGVTAVAKRKELQNEVRKAERELNKQISQRLPEFQIEPITLRDIQGQIPEDSALVEFVKYYPHDFRATDVRSTWGAPRYGAFVLLRGAKNPGWVPLGDAGPIDDQIKRCRANIEPEDPRNLFTDWAASEQEYLKLANRLYHQLWRPIESQLGNRKKIYLATDGQLHGLPFEALVDDSMQYLIESDYEMAYLTSGRDLLVRDSPSENSDVFVLGAPDFNMSPIDRVNRLRSPKMIRPALVGKVKAGRPIRAGGTWNTTAAMHQETIDATSAFEGTSYGTVKSFVGKDALEENLESIRQPNILILITHGYFFPDKPARGLGSERLQREENPLLRSGLVVAGANTLHIEPPPGVRVADGWVTAEEISQLDLRGTNLVVLSACDTNRAHEATGEAVRGMRSAFIFAGAQSIVGSLFGAEEDETPIMMKDFYEELKNGQKSTHGNASKRLPEGKLRALNTVKLRQIKRLREKHEGVSHPWFWAGYVLVGKP